MQEVCFYAVPKKSLVTIASGKKPIKAKQLVELAMHLELEDPELEVTYWIQIENKNDG